MDKVELFKRIDKIVGSPLCFLLGLIDKPFREKLPAATSLRKILVIKLIAIGDLVVALPTLAALRKSFPKAHLALMATPRVKEVVEGCPYLDEIIYYDLLTRDKGVMGLIKLIGSLRQKGFDLVLELDHYYRITSLITYFAGIKHRVGFDLPGQGRRGLITIKAAYRVDKHEVEAFLEAARVVGADVSNKELVEIWVSTEDKQRVDGFLAKEGIEADDLVVGIHPGTGPSAVSRRWPPERFAAVADWLMKEFQAKVVFTGGPDELKLVQECVRFMQAKPIIAAGKTSLKQFAWLTKRFRLFICVDTGPLHIAAAMKTPVIGLYGPNTPLKWGPYGKGHQTIYHQLPCSPCTRQYLGQVSRCKDPKCMQEIKTQEVMEAVRIQLEFNCQTSP